MKKWLFCFLTLTIAFPMGISEAQNRTMYKIIINSSNPVSSITVKKLSNIFLKKFRKWDDDQKIMPVDLYESSAIRERFSKKIHGKKVSSIKAYWQKKIFSGRGVPPPEKVSEQEVLEYVQGHPGAIGYISMSNSIENFKVKELKISK